MRRSTRRPWGAAILACLLAGLSGSRGQSAPEPLAEEPAAAASVLYETATVTARPLEQATAAVTVMEREEIEALNVASVAELLRFVAPGVDVTPSGPRGGFASAQIRGGDPNFTVVLLDGMPLNDATDQSFGGAVNLNGLSTALIERIEIVRGPLSSFFGSTGLAGVINIITRPSAGAAGGVRGLVAVGDASYGGAAVSLAAADERRQYALGASWEREEDRIEEDAFEQVAAQGSGAWSFGERAALRVVGRLTTWDAEDYPDASGGPTYGDGLTRSSEHQEANLGLEWDIGRPERPHRLRLSFYGHDLDRDSPAVAGPKFTVPASIEHTRFTHWRAGWTWPLVQGTRTRLAVGAEVAEERGRNDSTLFLPPEFGGGELDGSYEIERTTVGAFAELLAERGRWLFELGARADDPEGFEAELSPRGGVSYRFANEATRLRVSGGLAYKLPSFFALASPPPPFGAGNPELVPESVAGADAGIEHRFGGSSITTALTVFFYRYEDLIDFDFDTLQTVNRGRVETRGVELSATWTPVAELSLSGNLTRQDIDNLSSDDELRQRPEWIGAARLSWRPIERLELDVDGQSVSQRFDQQLPVPDRTTVAGYAIFGCAASYDVAPAWTLQGRIDNLLDRDYETFIGFPGAGRSLRLGLAYRPG